MCFFFTPVDLITGVYYYIRIVYMTTSFTPAIGVENRTCALYLADIFLRAHCTSHFLFVFYTCFIYLFSFCIGSWER